MYECSREFGGRTGAVRMTRSPSFLEERSQSLGSEGRVDLDDLEERYTQKRNAKSLRCFLSSGVLREVKQLTSYALINPNFNAQEGHARPSTAILACHRPTRFPRRRTAGRGTTSTMAGSTTASNRGVRKSVIAALTTRK